MQLTLKQCISSNAIVYILSCSFIYSFASDMAPVWPEYGPERLNHVATIIK